MGRSRRLAVALLVAVLLAAAMFRWLWGSRAATVLVAEVHAPEVSGDLGNTPTHHPRPPLPARSVAPPEMFPELQEPSPPLAEVSESGWGVLAIDVVDEAGDPADRAFVVPVDCPGLGPGPPSVVRVPVGPCSVRAIRQDGALFARSEVVTVEVGAVDPAWVMLELESVRTGGIGVRFTPMAQGMLVVEVVPGSPAAGAGLVAGDVVTEVDGQPTSDMDADTFVEEMTGAEGSEVTFTVGGSSGDTGDVLQTLTLERRFLDG